MRKVIPCSVILCSLLIFFQCAPESIAPIQQQSASDNATIQVDTIIYFNPETMEERMEIVTTNKLTKNTPKNRASESEIQVDTVITIDPDTYEETIHIVKKKKN